MEKCPKITLGFQGQDPGKWARGGYLGCQLCEQALPLTALHLISSICQGNCNNWHPQESPSQSSVQVKKTPRIPSLLLQSLHLKLGLISQTQFLATLWFGFKTLHPLLFSRVSSLTAVIESRRPAVSRWERLRAFIVEITALWQWGSRWNTEHASSKQYLTGGIWITLSHAGAFNRQLQSMPPGLGLAGNQVLC